MLNVLEFPELLSAATSHSDHTSIEENHGSHDPHHSHETPDHENEDHTCHVGHCSYTVAEIYRGFPEIILNTSKDIFCNFQFYISSGYGSKLLRPPLSLV